MINLDEVAKLAFFRLPWVNAPLVAPIIIVLSGCIQPSTSTYKYTSQVCPTIQTEDNIKLNYKWMGGISGICDAVDSKGKKVKEILTFLNLDPNADPSGQLLNPEEVSSALGSVIFGKYKQVIYHEDRIWMNMSAPTPSSNEIVFKLLDGDQLSNNPDVIKTNIFDYMSMSPNKKFLGEWRITLAYLLDGTIVLTEREQIAPEKVMPSLQVGNERYRPNYSVSKFLTSSKGLVSSLK